LLRTLIGKINELLWNLSIGRQQDLKEINAFFLFFPEGIPLLVKLLNLP
jgi:hypothetical protein